MNPFLVRVSNSLTYLICKSPGQAQRFLSAFGPIRNHFHPKQHQLTAKRYREQLRQLFQDWQEVACLKTTA